MQIGIGDMLLWSIEQDIGCCVIISDVSLLTAHTS